MVISLLSERVSELEAELTMARQHLEEQEAEANDAIAKWQESYTASEDRCNELEAEYQKILNEKEALQEKLDSIAISESSTTSESPDLSKISELQEELRIAQETLARDEEVVQQWEGKHEGLWRIDMHNTINALTQVCWSLICWSYREDRRA
jgi:chromosome segregation ATPase